MSYTDNETQNLIVNKLTKEQYKTITDSNTNNEVYHITDDAHYTEAEIEELLSAKQDNLTAGDGINIENGVISNTQTSAEWGNIQGDITQQTDLQNILNDNKLEINTKQNTLVDTQTIDVDGSSLTAIGVQSKSGDILYDWIGTEAEYNAGILDGTISEDWFCWITDDNGQEIDKKRDLFDVVLKDHILSYEESFGYIQLGDYVYSTPVLGVRYGYPTFYNKCVTEKQNSSTSQITLGSNTITMYVNPNGHQYYDIADKDIVDTFYEATGIAWFYGVDIENERIFLPRNDYYFKNGSIDNVGVIVEAGLPNITGKIVANKLSDWLPDGAFSVYSEEASLNGGTNATRQKVNLDASLSNPIYGNSDTVQPPSVSVLAYMVVGNIKTNEGYSEVVSQGKEILEQVNEGLESRANLNLSNVVSSNTKVIDGQWVAKQAVVSTSVATTLTQYDLSDYLPNDGYDYEVMINAFAYKNSDAIVAIGTDIFANTDVSDIDSGFWQVRCSNYSRHSVNDFILPVGQGRYLTTIASASASPFQLNVVGYRRLGTNQ